MALLFGFAVETAWAQFVEVTVEITATNYWPTNTSTAPVQPQRKFRAHCVIDQKCWLIQDNASANATCTYWFTGTNIVKYTLITKEPMAQDIRDAEDWLSQTFLGKQPPQRPGWSKPHLGKVLTEVIPSDGGPLRTMQSLPWLAFCSGSYLRTPGRSIPVPVYGGMPHVDGAFDKTSPFPDERGLPCRVEFYNPDECLRCTYEVQKSTNYLGSRWPLEFSVTRYPLDSDGVAKHLTHVVGKVLSIGKAEQLHVPAELTKAFEARRR